MNIQTKPALKVALTILGGILAASPTIPFLSAFAAELVPLGTFILGALHVQTPTATATTEAKP